MLEQGTGAGEFLVGPPGRLVHALDGQVLVVAEHDRHQVAGLGPAHPVTKPAEGGRVSQHQTHLVDDPGSDHGLGHGLRRSQVDGEWLLTEHRPAGAGDGGHQFGMGRRPGAHVDGVGGGDDVLDRGRHPAPVSPSEGLGPAAVPIEAHHHLGLDPGGQVPGMEVGDQTGAEKPDRHRRTA